MNHKIGLSLAALATLLTSALVASAQRTAPIPTPAPSIAPRVAVLPVALAPVTVDPQIRPVLAQKPRFDPARLAPRLSVQNGRTLLEIKNGRKYALEPAGAEPVPSPTLQMKQLPPQLAPLQPHIEAPIVAGKRIIKLPESFFDNTNSQTAIRDQGGRGTCTAFASVAGIEGWAKRAKNKTLDLSENHAFQLFMADANAACTVKGGYTTWKTGPVLTSHWVCTESLMPYDAAACPVVVPPVCTLTPGYRFALTSHFFSPKYGGTGSLRADNPNLLEAMLKMGYDVVYGVDVAGSDWGDGTLDTGVVDVQVDGNGNPVGGYGGHAMLLVGYNRVGQYFIFKNSWGTDAGHAGYVHLSYDYIQVYGKYGYAVMAVTGPGL